MREIRNFKGEVVRTESSSGNPWYRFITGNGWIILGVLFLLLGFFVPAQAVFPVLGFFDIRIWSWQHLLLISVIIGYAVSCWQIFRNWSEYSDSEERHAKNFILFGASVTVILSFLLILSIIGYLSLFFRPVVTMFSSGRLSLTGFWRLLLIIVSLIPLVLFGREWIVGFWED